MSRDALAPEDPRPAARYRLPAPTIGLKELHERIEGFLGDPEVPIYADTNIMSWMLRVGKEARAELLQWCRHVEERDGTRRLHVPVWAAHELHKVLRSRAPLSDARSALARHREGLQDLLAEMSFQASGERCGGDVPHFVGEALRGAVDLHRKLGVLAKSDRWYGEAEAEVVDFVNDRVLEGSVIDLVEAQVAAAEARLSVRIPPGFNDLHKDSNRTGDVLLWKEILRDAATRGAKRFVILTNDNKTDWTFPPRLLDYRGAERGDDPLNGLHARVAHPMLVHEARCSSFDDVVVVNPALLAVILDRSVKKKVKALVAATHPPRVEPQSGLGVDWDKLDPQPKRSRRRPMEAPEADGGPERPPRSEDSVTARPAGPDAMVSALRSDDATEARLSAHLSGLEGGVNERSDAFARLATAEFVGSLDPPAAALLGRRLFQAAAGDDSLAAALDAALAEVTTSPGPPTVAFVAGLWAELYLDDGCRPRPTPSRGPFEPLFASATGEAFADAHTAVLSLLGEGASALLARPGSPSAVPLGFVTRRVFGGEVKSLRQVLAGAIELLCEMPPGDPNTLREVLRADAGSAAEVVAALSRRFVVPLARLAPDIEAGTALSWAPELALRSPRTDLGTILDPAAARAP